MQQEMNGGLTAMLASRAKRSPWAIAGNVGFPILFADVYCAKVVFQVEFESILSSRRLLLILLSLHALTINSAHFKLFQTFLLLTSPAAAAASATAVWNRQIKAQHTI